MSAGGASAAAAGAAAARMQAIKASGAIVLVESNEFMRLVDREDGPLIVHAAPQGLFASKHQYLMSHKGLIFCAKSPIPLELPRDCEIVEARKIWIP